MDLISGSRGTRVVNDNTKTTVAAIAYFTLEDTVIDELEISGVDVLSDFVTTPATAIKAGFLLVDGAGRNFNAIKLTSGSVVELKA